MTVGKKNIILEKTFWFGVSILEFGDILVAQKRFVVADQILRSGTSVGANMREAQNASSLKEFVKIVKIAIREAEETEHWLQLCSKAKGYPTEQKLMTEIREIILMLAKIIVTSKAKLKAQKASARLASKGGKQ